MNPGTEPPFWHQIQRLIGVCGAVTPLDQVIHWREMWHISQKTGGLTEAGAVSQVPFGGGGFPRKHWIIFIFPFSFSSHLLFFCLSHIMALHFFPLILWFFLYPALRPWMSEFSQPGVKDFSQLALDLSRNQLVVGAR